MKLLTEERTGALANYATLPKRINKRVQFSL